MGKVEATKLIVPGHASPEKLLAEISESHQLLCRVFLRQMRYSFFSSVTRMRFSQFNNFMPADDVAALLVGDAIPATPSRIRSTKSRHSSAGAFKTGLFGGPCAAYGLKCGHFHSPVEQSVEKLENTDFARDKHQGFNGLHYSLIRRLEFGNCTKERH